jgi:hypothetical protein
MYNHKWMPASVLTVLFAMQSAVSNAEPRIGTTASTRPNVEAVAEGNTHTLSAGSDIYAKQTVRTGNRGKADLVFIDSTNLTVGPTSEVRLDKFVYDPTGSSGSVVVQATRGAFRFVTGSQAKRAYQFDTPHGTLGVRGTKVEVKVATSPRDECATKVRLIEGEANFTVAKTKKVARLTQPNACACISQRGDITYSYCPESLVEFSEAEPPPPPFVPGGAISPVTVPTIVSPTQLPL